MKIRPVEGKVFHTDGQTNRRTDGRTDMTKFSKFSERSPKK